MQAIILAGGGGERLRPLTRVTPKPLLPVVNRPVLERLLENLARAGCDEALLTTFYLAPQINAWLQTYTPPIPVRVVQEPRPLGTAGCVKNAAPFLQDTFLVAPGDVVAEVDFCALFHAHHKHAADATLMAVRVQDTREFGVLEVHKNGQIARFQEKPAPHEAFSNLANAGFYVLEKRVLEFVPNDEAFDFSRGLFPLLLQHNARFFAHETRGYWADIGTLASYRAANRHVLNGAAIIQPGAIVHPNTMLHAPYFIARGCVLEAGAVVGPGTVLGANCRLQTGARVQESVLGENVMIGANTIVQDSLLASRVRVGAGARISGAALGADVQVGVAAQLGEGTRLDVDNDLVNDNLVNDNIERASSTQSSANPAPAHSHGVTQGEAELHATPLVPSKRRVSRGRTLANTTRTTPSVIR